MDTGSVLNLGAGTGDATNSTAALAALETAAATAAAQPAVLAAVVDLRSPTHVAVSEAGHESPEWDGRFLAGKAYRVRFKNGIESECDGEMLATNFPFHPEQVDDIRLVSDVGK